MPKAKRKVLTHKAGVLASVYTANDAESFKPSALTISGFKCQSCNQKVAYSSNIPEPFCITCGSDELEPVDNSVDAEQFEDEDVQTEELTSIECPHCAKLNVMAKRTASLLGGIAHCVVCSEELDFTDHVNELSDDVDLFETEDLADEDDSVVIGEDTEVFTSDDAPDEPDTEIEASEEDELDSENVDLMEEVIEDPLTVNVDEDIDFAETDDGLLAMYKGTPFATLTKASAGENADVVHKPAFRQAVKTSAKTVGLAKALKDTGFASIVISVNSNRKVEQKVKARTASLITTYNSERKEIVSKWKHALQIASVGVMKGFWKGTSNPLKASVEKLLKDSGVRSSTSLTASILRQAGEDYADTIIEKAEDLLDKDPELLNQIAETLQDTDVPEEQVEDTVEDDLSVQARVKGAGLRTEVNSNSAIASSDATVIHKGMFLKR